MRRTSFVLAALLSATSVVQAEPAGALLGVVRTADGTPVPNFVLVLRGPDAVRIAITGAEGRYRATGLTPGRYVVGLRTPGFVIQGTTEAEVRAAEVPFDLTLGPAPVREHVVVAATRDEAALSTVGVTATVLDE